MDAKRAARIQALTASMGWKDLQEEMDAQEQRFWDRHIADVKNPNQTIDQIELARSLGKLDGIRAILAAPDKAAAILLREEAKEESADA